MRPNPTLLYSSFIVSNARYFTCQKTFYLESGHYLWGEGSFQLVEGGEKFHLLRSRGQKVLNQKGGGCRKI